MVDVRSVKDMTSNLATTLAGGSRAEAGRLGVAVTTVVVDRGGHPVFADRMDGAATCAFPLALAKAETAAATLAATEVWLGTTQPGQPDWGMTIAVAGRFIAMPGSLPVSVDGEVVGAIGVSGGEASQDVICAVAGLVAAGIGRAA